MSSTKRFRAAAGVGAVLVGFLMAGVGACAPKAASPPPSSSAARKRPPAVAAKPATTRPTQDPRPRRDDPPAWIMARAAVAFPLEREELPSTGGQLVGSMHAAWKGRVKFSDPAR